MYVFRLLIAKTQNKYLNFHMSFYFMKNTHTLFSAIILYKGKNNFYLVETALKEDGFSLKYASEELKNNY